MPGTSARYGFSHPLNWADELAAILFLWLVMFGSVIALGRNEHMRLTLVVGMVTPRKRLLLETLSTLVVTLLLLLLLLPATHYVSAEWIITTPALELPDGLRVLGLAVGWSRAIYAGVYPLMIGFNAIPKVAVVPILVLWFGIGFIPAVLTAFLISFFPIVVNVATGLATMEPELEDVLRALGASKLDIMLKVGIPRTQPYLFGSLKVAITLAFVGTVVSETVGANAGLGYQIALAGSNFQMPLVFAALLLLAVEGIAMYAVFAYVEVYFTRWAFRSSMSAAAA